MLVVDDEATGRTYARMLLEKEGYRVSEAPDGVAALEQLKAARFELVILDLDMPRLGGRDVLRRLRASITTAGLPVVVFTGTNDPTPRFTCWRLAPTITSASRWSPAAS